MAKQIALLGFLLGTLVLLFLFVSTAATPKSKDPFYPCQTSTDSTNIFGGIINVAILCNNINGKRVKTAFENSKIYRIARFVFKLENKKDENIPANVIGNHSIGEISTHCSGKQSPLRVNSGAFSLTKLFTETLNIFNCNLRYLDWSFLKGFSNLKWLYIVENSYNLHQRFYTLPTRTLAKLDIFKLDSVLGLNGFNNTCLKFPAPPPNGLFAITIDNCYDVGTAALQNFFEKWATPTSVRTLSSLSLSKNSLTRIPSEVSKYRLGYVEISGNLQPLTIQSGSFYVIAVQPSWPVPVYAQFILHDSKITYISPGAFYGDDTWAYFDLSGNQLTTLVFNAFSFSGFPRLELAGNPFDCSVKNQCNLAWMIRSDNYYVTAKCSNGTMFTDLNANNLQYPNVINVSGLTEIDLRGNKLTTFDENVFDFAFELPDLGYIYADGNPFDCSTQNQCKMAWLFQSEGFLPDFIVATCSNGTKFRDLNANNLRWPDGSLCS